MKYIMDSLETFDNLEPIESDYELNTELLEYKWTSMANMAGYGLALFDEYSKKTIDGFYYDFIKKSTNFYMR
jgi:hypothetical protein